MEEALDRSSDRLLNNNNNDVREKQSKKTTLLLMLVPVDGSETTDRNYQSSPHKITKDVLYHLNRGGNLILPMTLFAYL